MTVATEPAKSGPMLVGGYEPLATNSPNKHLLFVFPLE